MTQLRHPGAHTPDQTGRLPLFLLLRRKVGKDDRIHGKAGRLDADYPLVVLRDDGDHIQIDAAGQHPAPLVVGMVAANLRAPGGAEKPNVTIPTEQRGKFLASGGIPPDGSLRLSVKQVEIPIVLAGFHRLFFFHQQHSFSSFIFTWTMGFTSLRTYIPIRPHFIQL